MSIKEVEIKNFKSIKHLKLKCKRINILIGEPNTGKSNILEAVVGTPSLSYYNSSRFGSDPKTFVRFEKYSNLFYDNNLESPITIEYKGQLDFQIKIYFKDGFYYFKSNPDLTPEISFPPSYTTTYKLDQIAKLFKFYRFRLNRFDRRENEFLLPPDGRNLVSVYLTHKSVKTICREILTKFGLKMMIDIESNDVKVVKETEDILITYPYSTLSDTFQRLIFYLSAILTNKDSIIAIEEPEAHAFPYYTKFLAELIALNENNNQYFITTHNPYFLLSLIEKASKKDIAVFLTYYQNYQTKIKMLTESELQEILDSGIDIFFNIDRFLED